MALDAANARIFGSDDDKVQLAPLGSTLPTTLAAAVAPFEDVGWLHTDGIPFTPADSVEKLRGHQGGRVVRTTITESDLTFQFQCLETTALTLGLQHNITSAATLTGVTTMNASPGRQIEARAFVLDLFDKDNTDIHYRSVVPAGRSASGRSSPSRTATSRATRSTSRSSAPTTSSRTTPLRPSLRDRPPPLVLCADARGGAPP